MPSASRSTTASAIPKASSELLRLDHGRAAHTREVASLPWHHRDPFDRMLIAQARVADLRFVTADKVAADYGDFVLLVR